MKKTFAGIAALISTLTSLHAAAPGEIIRGPVFSGTIMSKGKPLAYKGLVVTLGAEKRAFMCYDADTMRAAAGWTDDFLEFGNTQTQIAWPPPPSVKGKLGFESKNGPGWAKGESLTDPRTKQMGPLPKDWAHYRGLYLNGDQVVLSYTVGKVGLLELPGVDKSSGLTVFTRTIQLDSSEALTLVVCDTAGTAEAGEKLTSFVNENVTNPDASTATAVAVEGEGVVLQAPTNGKLVAQVKGKKGSAIKISIWSGLKSDLGKFKTAVAAGGKLPDLAKLTKGGAAHWPETVVNQGVLGTNGGSYVVDLLPEPLPNPWNSKTFFGGFDFLPDGRAAICTFHGDVWMVSGIDAKLEKLTWRRYATGLFQPLGVKVVNGLVHVTGRDQITRLHDLNDDGEADFYENFNNDSVVTDNYHEFSLDLHTDTQGNFYYAKGAPWPPNVTSPHQGVMLKVSKDGSDMEVFATGLRAPNGMTVGPNNEILVGDNQGHYMPSSKVSMVKKGGYYGMKPAAHRTPAPAGKASEEYDQPVCWVPMNMDNSSGGQVYVTSDKWGPFNGQPLFMSYGKCTLFHMMTEEVDGVTQGGMVQFPLKFNSGLMRARFNPKDGQFYGCGLKGWQTSAARDGGFFRVRYTGAPVNDPVGLRAKKNGLEISFPNALDEASAKEAANWSVEQWNYQYSGGYGSGEFSVADPAKKGHDPVNVSGVTVSADKKSVFLQVAEVVPAMQMKIKMNIKAADGSPITSTIHNTIHKVGPAR